MAESKSAALPLGYAPMRRRIAAGRLRAVGRRNIATPPSLINVAAKRRSKLVNSAYSGRFESKDGNGIFSFLASMMRAKQPAREPNSCVGAIRREQGPARYAALPRRQSHRHSARRAWKYCKARVGAAPDRHLALSPAPARSPRFALPFPPSGVPPKLYIGSRAGTI